MPTLFGRPPPSRRTAPLPRRSVAAKWTERSRSQECERAGTGRREAGGVCLREKGSRHGTLWRVRVRDLCAFRVLASFARDNFFSTTSTTNVDYSTVARAYRTKKSEVTSYDRSGKKTHLCTCFIIVIHSLTYVVLRVYVTSLKTNFLWK